jgi:hypothetical protein
MAEEPAAIDISNMPDLLSVVAKVRTSNQPLVLRQDSEDVAVVVPLPGNQLQARAPDDCEAALATAGSWKDLVDGETLKEHLDAERGSDRAPASL